MILAKIVVDAFGMVVVKDPERIETYLLMSGFNFVTFRIQIFQTQKKMSTIQFTKKL